VSVLSRGVAPRRRLAVTARGRERRNRRPADQEVAQSRDFFQATLDSLVAHIAVLNAEGEIIMTNRAWARFAIDNGAVACAGEQNYLAVSDAAVGEATAVEAAAGLRAIIAGRLAEFSLEYPCHSPTFERWYLVHATRYTGPGQARVVVVHVDITRRVVAQRALLSERKARQESVHHEIEELALIKRVEDALAQEQAAIQLPVTLAFKAEDPTVEILINGDFQTNRLTSAGAAMSLRARGGGLYLVAFRNRGHDPRCGARPVNLRSIVYAGRFYRAGRSCTPITVPTTSTADFRTTRRAGARGCSWPGRSRGATRPGRSRRLAWSTWHHRTGRAHRRCRCDGLHRIRGADRTHGAHRRHGRHRICGTTGTTWRDGHDGISGSNRAAGHRRI